MPLSPRGQLEYIKIISELEKEIEVLTKTINTLTSENFTLKQHLLDSNNKINVIDKTIKEYLKLSSN